MSAQVYRFPIKNKKERNIVSIVSKLWEDYKKYSDDIKRRKIRFLYHQAEQYFYDLYLTEETIRTKGKVDFHPSIYARERAKIDAKKAVLQVEAINKIDYYYNLRMKEFKKRGI